MTRRDALRAAFVGVPILALVLLVRCAGPALDRWKRERTAGEGYATVTVPATAAFWELTILPKRLPEAQAVVSEIDAFAAGLCAAEGGLGLARPSGVVRLLLLEDRAALLTYAGTATGKSFDNNGGYYSRTRREICLMWEGRTVERLLPDLRHEATHLLVDLSSSTRGVSPWLSEGLACACETGGLPRRLEGITTEDVEVLSRDGPMSGVSPADRDRRRLALEALDRIIHSRQYLTLAQHRLARGGTLDLPNVLDADQAAFLQADNDRVYGVSAATVLWFLVAAGPEVRARFLEHVRRERESGPTRAAGLEANVGIALPALEAQITAWLRALPMVPEGG